MEGLLDPIALRNDELHRRAAEALRRDESLVAAARRTLDRWVLRDGEPAHPVLLEWRAVLDMLTPGELAEFLESPSPFARRLRASSPFLALSAGR